MPEKIRLSVVMPTLNEEVCVAKVIEDIRTFAAGTDLEIVIVDSSTDRTAEIAESMGVRVLRQERQGPGKAVIAGLQASKGDAVMMADCDDTYPMEDIPKFLGWWKEGYDFVNGNRINSLHDAMPKLNRFGNWMFAFLVRVLYRIPTWDVASGMRLYSRRLIDSEPWETNLAFWIEIIVKAKKKGFKFKEIPITYRPRIGETTLNAWRSSRAFLLCILKYRFGLGFIPNDLL